MVTGFLHIGFGNVLAAKRVLAILPGTSASRGAFSSSTGRLIKEGKKQAMVIDMTSGRRTKAVVVMDTGHIVLAAIGPRTMVGRLGTEGQGGASRSSDWQDVEEQE